MLALLIHRVSDSLGSLDLVYKVKGTTEPLGQASLSRSHSDAIDQALRFADLDTVNL